MGVVVRIQSWDTSNSLICPFLFFGNLWPHDAQDASWWSSRARSALCRPAIEYASLPGVRETQRSDRKEDQQNDEGPSTKTLLWCNANFLESCTWANTKRAMQRSASLKVLNGLLKISFWRVLILRTCIYILTTLMSSKKRSHVAKPLEWWMAAWHWVFFQGALLLRSSEASETYMQASIRKRSAPYISHPPLQA